MNSVASGIANIVKPSSSSDDVLIPKNKVDGSTKTSINKAPAKKPPPSAPTLK